MKPLLCPPSVRTALPFRLTLLMTLIATSLSGCQTINQAGDSVGRTTLGCVGGALLGGVIGAAVSGEKGALKGAAIGLAAGCVAGYAWEEHEKELRRLAEEENMRIEIERVYAQQGAELQQRRTEQQQASSPQQEPQTVGLVAQVADEAMFNVGSAELTTAGQRQLDKLAALFFKNRQQEEQKKAPVLVIGHTDATGDAAFNQQLSEQRARQVVEILARQGIAREHLYYQGAGAGRPLADNNTEAGRAANRRVELVELQDDQVLAQRIAAEQQNPRYIQHGTSVVGQSKSSVPLKSAAPKTNKSPATTPTTAKTSGTKPVATVAKPNKTSKKKSAIAASAIDFGGKPASSQWELIASFKPDYSAGFGLISSAIANEAPLASCSQDAPRVIGEVKNLAGKAVEQHKTTEYLPGMNGKVWAAKVNGHVVYINPVAVLKEDAQLAQQPTIAVTEHYDQGQRKITARYPAVATTYKGKDNLLMRVFIEDPQAPMQCLDILLPYGGPQAQQGALYYDKVDQEFVADYAPRNTSI